jgi:NADPH2:quinone reductase
VGAGVAGFQVGDRVAYAGRPNGAYAEARVMPADILVKLPDAISFDTAAAMMLQGMTVQYLLRQTYAVQPGETILFHAAAGGIGLIACQWARALGVNLIGTVSSDERRPWPRSTRPTSSTTRPRTSSNASRNHRRQRVPVVYDAIGKDTFTGSLDCLRPRGMMVSFGNASGPVAPFGVSELASRGSLFLTRPSLGNYIATRPELDATAGDLFDMVQRQDQHRDQPALRLEGCRPGPRRPGRPQDHRFDHPDPVIAS